MAQGLQACIEQPASQVNIRVTVWPMEDLCFAPGFVPGNSPSLHWADLTLSAVHMTGLAPALALSPSHAPKMQRCVSRSRPRSPPSSCPSPSRSW